jgi:hypothetical protein
VTWDRSGGRGGGAASSIPRDAPSREEAFAPMHKGHGGVRQAGDSGDEDWVKTWDMLDVDINTSDTSTPTHNQICCSINRAHACQLNNQVSSFLASYSYYLDNGNMCSIWLLRNDGQRGNRVTIAPAIFRF